VKHIKSRGKWPSDPLFAEDAVDDHPRMTAALGGTGGMRSDHRGVRVAQTEGTDNQDCHPDDDYDDYDNCHPLSDDRNGAYKEGGIVFNNTLGRDELALNTNRLATLRVMAD
jgi:hypothetical protein